MSGSTKSMGSLRTAFSQAGGGLSQHNQRRMARGKERRREAQAGRQHSGREQSTKRVSKGRVGMKEKMTGESDCMLHPMVC